mmetsp:Transcript_34953/g.30796  ORF Transcript_34953/g.30796 Transcript_34953/m.30796 type:complete len:360 (+) Transcript_34953:115-1194(+)
MSTRARLQNSNDSKSLWNYTLSPGWSEFDAHILRLAVMRYGCGAWREINKHFPLKTCGQLNLQTQRLFGQQALAEFNKVHIDPSRIKAINDKIDGFRKNTCLINEGNNLRAEEKERRRQAHIKKYGIPKEIYEQIQVPVVLDPPMPCKTVIDNIEKLREMYRAVYDIQLRIKHLKMNNGKNAANIAVKSKQNKNKNKSQNNQNSSNNNKNEDKEKEKEEEKMEVEVEIVATKQKEPEPVPEPEPEPVVAEPAAPAPAPNMMDMDMDGMDEETAMALALSASMASTNINTPAIEKKSKSKSKKKSGKKSGKKSTKKKTKSAKKKSAKKSSKKSRKRKKMDSDDEYEPAGAQPKKKRSRKK